MAEWREGLWMTAKERDRLKAGIEGVLGTQTAGTLRARGDNALRHGLRGRPSNRKMPEAVKRRVMALFRERKQATLWHDTAPHWRRKS